MTWNDQGTRETTVIVGLFVNREDADRAVEELRDMDFPAAEIGVAYHPESGGGPFDPATNPGIDADAAYDPTTHPRGAETSRTGGSPFTQTDEELAWEKEKPEGVMAQLADRGGEANRDPAATLEAAGVPAGQAQSLARRLPPGGAVIAIRSTQRASEAANIFERNNGSTHREPASE